MKKYSKILITGAQGMVGKVLVHQLKEAGFNNVIGLRRTDVDLCVQNQVEEYFNRIRPDYVFHLAAKVGGIRANLDYPGQFIFENTLMQINVIHSAFQSGIKKLLFCGSACTYPRNATNPITEDMLNTGKPELTNLAYATAKLNGIVMCQAYFQQYGLKSVLPMPTNIYGPGDDFKTNNSHVIPALIRKIYLAKKQKKREVILWGSGEVKREFIYIDDLAKAMIFLMQSYESNEIINIGTYDEIIIKDLAVIIAKILEFDGNIKWDKSKPDGMPRKCLDSTKLFSMQWRPKVNLETGIKKTYIFFLKNHAMHVNTDMQYSS